MCDADVIKLVVFSAPPRSVLWESRVPMQQGFNKPVCCCPKPRLRSRFIGNIQHPRLYPHLLFALKVSLWVCLMSLFDDEFIQAARCLFSEGKEQWRVSASVHPSSSIVHLLSSLIPWNWIWIWKSWISSHTDLWFDIWGCTNICMAHGRSSSRSCMGSWASSVLDWELLHP